MKKFLLIALSILFISPVFADNIQYGYNAQGDYVPTSVGGNRIQYGYNAQGDYVPTGYGN